MYLKIIKYEYSDNKLLLPPISEAKYELKNQTIDDLIQIEEIYPFEVYFSLLNNNSIMELKVGDSIKTLINNVGYEFILTEKKVNELTLEICNKMVNRNDISKEDLYNILIFLKMQLNKHIRGLEIPELLVKILKKNINFDDFETVFILENIINGYMHSDYNWRGKDYAYLLFDKLLALNELSQNKTNNIAKVYYELGLYLYNVSDVKTALKVFENCFKITNLLTLKKESLYYIIVCNNHLGNINNCPLSDEELKMLGPSLLRIENAIRGQGYLKRDPIENTELFQKVYNDVHERTIIKIGPNTGMGYCYLLWNTLKEEYKKEGIDWKTPKMCNPKIRFD